LAHVLTVLQQHSLGSSALSPKTWPFDIEFLPAQAYLVGGSVRDALLERHSDYLDLDFVMPTGAVETAAAIARHYRAGFVLLDAERQIARVVFRQGTADFAQQVGDSLEEDLRRRDFTMNAIAYNPHTLELFDPLEGCLDLERCVLRMISAENLAEDPLRLLRAYRQAAQLNFTIDPATEKTLADLAPLLKEIAAERIQSELNYLLSSSRGTQKLQAAWAAGLLKDWLPHITAEGMAQVGSIDRSFKALRTDWTSFAEVVAQRIRSQNQAMQLPPKEVEPSGSLRTWLTIAKLASLMSRDPEVAEQELWRLKYSRAEIQAVVVLLKNSSTLEDLLLERSVESTAGVRELRRSQYFFFQKVGIVFPALMISAIATPLDMASLRPLINRYLDPQDVVAHPQPVLSGQDLMQSLSLPPSPQIGKILSALQVAKAEGQIETRDEAIALAQHWLDQGEL
jgi:tRNA nucleotidyltransferase (CCA-adding enzyme)